MVAHTCILALSKTEAEGSTVEAGLQGETLSQDDSLSPKSRTENHKNKRRKYVIISSWRRAGFLKG